MPFLTMAGITGEWLALAQGISNQAHRRPETPSDSGF
jgi:hypothetical protein